MVLEVGCGQLSVIKDDSPSVISCGYTVVILYLTSQETITKTPNPSFKTIRGIPL